jgi:hypothetical protein
VVEEPSSGPSSRVARARLRSDHGWHRDMVKELRNGGEIQLDGEVVQKDGAWQF